MGRLVTHRWRMPDGQDPPAPGEVIRGRTRRHSWRVVEVRPIESPIHPNDFRGWLEPLGPWEPCDRFDRYYVPRT